MNFASILWDASGDEIEKETFRRIEKELTPGNFSCEEYRVARRLVHTTGDFSIVKELVFANSPIEAGLEALRKGKRIYSDSNMIKSGISVPKLKKFHASYTRESILCPVADQEVKDLAQKEHLTRALAAVRLHKNFINDAIFLCGNAPLALAGVIKMCAEDSSFRPALIIGMPVGFVNVVESKKLLTGTKLPYIAVMGNRGGSPLAVATMHAIMESGGELEE